MSTASRPSLIRTETQSSTRTTSLATSSRPRMPMGPWRLTAATPRASQCLGALSAEDGLCARHPRSVEQRPVLSGRRNRPSTSDCSLPATARSASAPSSEARRPAGLRAQRPRASDQAQAAINVVEGPNLALRQQLATHVRSRKRSRPAAR